MTQRRRPMIMVGSTVVGMIALAGCGMLRSPGGPDTGTSAAMSVEVQVTSDANTAGQRSIDVDARKSPQRVDQTDEPLPYQRQFTVPLDTPFPLRGTTVEATAAPGASWIACSITLDGDIVAERRVEGDGAIAVCEKKLTVGPQ